MKVRLNLGCGNDYKEDYVNMDLTDDDIYVHDGKLKVDVQHDLNDYPYPFKDNQFEEIYAKNCLEFMKDFEKGMKEFSRICKNRARIFISVPYFSCCMGYREFSCNKFSLYHRQLFKIFKKNNLILKERGFIIKNWSMKWIEKLLDISTFTQNVYERFFSGIIPANEIYWKLEVKKK